MIDHDRLEEAIQYRDRLKDLLTFKEGFLGQKWNGLVTCKFGSYQVELSMDSAAVSEPFRTSLIAEEKMLRNALEFFGVKFP